MSDDLHLFREHMQGVKPLKTAQQAALEARIKPPSLAQQARRAAAEAFIEGDLNPLTSSMHKPLKPWDELSFKRPGVQEGVFRRLRLGQYEIDAKLDLHRMTVEQARVELFSFLADCVRYELRTVLVLHGKGERSLPQQSVLKSFVAQWLPELQEVLAFHSAQPKHGGLGAVYVLLRKSERERLDNRERYARRQG